MVFSLNVLRLEHNKEWIKTRYNSCLFATFLCSPPLFLSSPHISLAFIIQNSPPNFSHLSRGCTAAPDICGLVKADMFDFYSGQLQLKSIFVLDFKPWSSHWLHAPLFFIWIKKPNVTLFLNPPLSLICQHPSCSFTPLAHCYRKYLFSALHTALSFPAQVQLNWTLNSNLLTFEAPH